MSGHSKWSTIKRQKEANDQARGKVFSKLSQAISAAVKMGGGDDPETNYKLRVAIDAAKDANMPKENVERAISKGSGDGAQLDEVMYEGFAPGGVGLLISAITDNRNRTAAEIKNILEKAGGSMGGPGSVSFGFRQMGYFIVSKGEKSEELALKLIESGIEDMREKDHVFGVYTKPEDLMKISKKLEADGVEVEGINLVQVPQNPMVISEKDLGKIQALCHTLNEHDDVQQVFKNIA